MAATDHNDAPGFAGVKFDYLSNPFFANNGQVVAAGYLNTGSGGVTTFNSMGLWAFDQVQGNRLLARQGVGNVPGVPDADFLDFIHWTGNAEGDVLVHASLDTGLANAGGIIDDGIWLYPYEGAPQLLVRVGDELAGRTIAELSFPTTAEGNEPVRNIFNDEGQFVFRATFSNGDYGLFLYSPGESTIYSPADFNTDNHVNMTDFNTWRAAYLATNSQGDVDNDGDTDGRDFLYWQREHTDGTLVSALAVPEPSVWSIAALASLFAVVRTRFSRRESF